MCTYTADLSHQLYTSLTIEHVALSPQQTHALRVQRTNQRYNSSQITAIYQPLYSIYIYIYWDITVDYRHRCSMGTCFMQFQVKPGVIKFGIKSKVSIFYNCV